MIYRVPVIVIALTTVLVRFDTGAGEDPAVPNRRDPGWLLPSPRIKANSKIPTLSQVLGYEWAGEVSSHTQIERYLRALADAAPDRAKLVVYGKSYEGRTLYYLVITSPGNIARLEPIRENNLRLSEPSSITPDEARGLIDTSPGIVWLAYSVHGNEISSSDAALLTAYHLLADESPETREAVESLVVIIDPLQNPDGRERFVNVFRETRGRFSAPDPWASEHTERWPGGRFNHYLFDMNRDWFLQSQQETRHKVAAYLHWQPHIYVDAHEMGQNSTYYFVPPTDPITPFLLPRQLEWLYRLGRAQARRFDQYGFSYTTREMFDAFYPGYGSEWPTLHGGIGVLWEQASARGLVIDRDDETKLYYHDGVRHHYVSALATIELASKSRRQLVEDFHEARRRGIELGREGPVRHFFILEGPRPDRAFQLVKLLVRNGIHVHRTDRPLQIVCTDARDGHKSERNVPAGSYHVPVSQPAGRLLRALLDRSVPMDEEFVERQLRRNERRVPDEIYDVTAWSLPLAFDVECLSVGDAVDVSSRPWNGAPPSGEVIGGPAKVAYLVAGDDDGVMRALARWLQAGLRVHVADQPLKLGQVHFPRGTLVLKTNDNPDGLHEVVAQAARQLNVTIHGTDTGFVDEGAHLGGPYVTWVRPPKIAMLVDEPTNYSVGHTWYLLDQVWRYPTTRVAGLAALNRLDMNRYNVLIMPHGAYTREAGVGEALVKNLKQWVQRGGALILVKGAAAWAASDDVGLLDSKLVNKPAAPDDHSAEKKEKKPEPSTASEDAAAELPDAVPGAFLRADVFDDHFITFGVSPTIDVFYSGNVILSPVGPNRGRNLVTFREKDKLLTSGFCWPQTIDLIAQKPYVVYQALGDGHVVAFADDPNYRAMYPALQRLFFNAAMFGPGH